METRSIHRQLASYFVVAPLSMLIFLAPATVARGQSPITVSPGVIETGTETNLTIGASGSFDLAEVGDPQISLRPNDGVTRIRIREATGQRLILSVQLERRTRTGTRTLLIKNNEGRTVVALDLVVRIGSHICRPSCNAPLVCQENVCGVSSSPIQPVPCNPPCGPSQACEFGRCVVD